MFVVSGLNWNLRRLEALREGNCGICSLRGENKFWSIEAIMEGGGRRNWRWGNTIGSV